MKYYRKEEIAKIHREAKAVKGTIYVSSTGQKFRGSKEGRLERIFDSSTVKNFSNYVNFNGYSVQEVLKEIDSYITTLANLGYKEFTYNINGDLTNMDVWSDSSKAVKTSEYTYTYNSGNLETIDVNNLTTNTQYQKLLSYDINNNLTSIEIL